MTEESFPNPPILASPPNDGDVVQYDADTNTWVPVSVADAGAITVPQTGPSIAAVTTSDLATTAATQTTPWGFASEAQAEAIATKFNLAVADITALRLEVNEYKTLLTAAGIFD